MMLRIWAWCFDTIPSAKSTLILACAALVGLFVIMVGIAMFDPPQTHIVPPCNEDELVVGIGDFTSDGYWSEYICIHPDTIIHG